MTILVTYASKHGATQRIAERIGDTLRAAGLAVETWPIHEVNTVTNYDAFVIGSAVYFGHWRKAAAVFARRHEAILASRPVWLFSSGPLGTETTDAGAVPAEIAEVVEVTKAREHHVFPGALDHTHFDLPERVIWALPASHELLKEGDFRDWAEVDTWAAQIALALAPALVPVGARTDG